MTFEGQGYPALPDPVGYERSIEGGGNNKFVVVGCATTCKLFSR